MPTTLLRMTSPDGLRTVCMTTTATPNRMDVAELVQRARVLAALLGELHEAIGELELAATDRLDVWVLRGAEVRVQAARDSVHSAEYALDAMHERLARGAS